MKVDKYVTCLTLYPELRAKKLIWIYIMYKFKVFIILFAVHINIFKRNTYWDVRTVHHQEDTLQPPLPLLQEVVDGEGRLLPHFPLYEVERVTLPQGHHAKVVVLCHAAVRAVIEGHAPLCPKLEDREVRGDGVRGRLVRDRVIGVRDRVKVLLHWAIYN